MAAAAGIPRSAFFSAVAVAERIEENNKMRHFRESGLGAKWKGVFIAGCFALAGAGLLLMVLTSLIPLHKTGRPNAVYSSACFGVPLAIESKLSLLFRSLSAYLAVSFCR